MAENSTPDTGATTVTISADQMSEMVEGVQLLAIQSQTLNERVYSKNALDRTRNVMLAGLIAITAISGVAFATLGLGQRAATRKADAAARQRSADAVAARRQLSDCNQPPGVELFEGVKPGDPPYINPGKCFTEQAERTKQFLQDGIDGIRFSQDCIYLRDHGQRPQVCAAVNARIDSLRGNVNPFPNRGVLSTTPTTRPNTTTTTIRPPPPTTTTTRPPMAAPPPPPPSGGLGEVVCSVLGLLRLCG